MSRLLIQKMSSQVSYFWSFCNNQEHTFPLTRLSYVRIKVFMTILLNWNVSKMTTNIEIFEEFPLMF